MWMEKLICPLEKQTLVEMPVVENFNNLERKTITWFGYAIFIYPCEVHCLKIPAYSISNVISHLNILFWDNLHWPDTQGFVG